MARQKLNMTPEERKIYDRDMHNKQTRKRREKAEREALILWIRTIINTFEQLGWDRKELVVGADDEMINAVADEIIKTGEYKIVLGNKIGVKRIKND